MGASRNWVLLSHLTRAILKITRRITSMLSRCGGGSNEDYSGQRLRSLGSFQTGLYRSVDADTATPRNRVLSWRARSCSEEGDDEDGEGDVDGRAEDFIARFRRQLLMERQVSLAQRYRRGDSFQDKEKQQTFNY